MIDVSRLSAKGQVTIPIEIRKALNLKEGEKVAFILDDDGTVTIANSAMLALREIQKLFSGTAEELGLKDESEVPAFIKSVLKD